MKAEDCTKASIRGDLTTHNNTLPFWNMNVPSERHTEECPDFLKYAIDDDKDQGILGLPDSEFRRQTWTEVRQLINDNRIDLFKRLPSDLRRYREYCDKLKKEYGSVGTFVQQERLKWSNLTPKGLPFSEHEDMKILYNDWPYGIDTRIIHLVIWTKFDLESEEVSPFDLTPKARRQINDFVNRTFVRVCGQENVIWFKNWKALKSIHALEHFHVMLFDPNMDFVEAITGGDVPLSQKVGKPNELK